MGRHPYELVEQQGVLAGGAQKRDLWMCQAGLLPLCAPALCKLSSAQWLKSSDKQPQQMLSKETLWTEEKDRV